MAGKPEAGVGEEGGEVGDGARGCVGGVLGRGEGGCELVELRAGEVGEDAVAEG